MVERRLIADVDLFAGLDAAQFDRLWASGDDHIFEAGQTIFDIDDPATELFIVSDGRVEIFAGSRSLAMVERGDLFGEMALFDGGGRSARAIAFETCSLIAIPYEQVKPLYLERPELLWRVVSLVVGRLRHLDAAIDAPLVL